jgi:hypothetical protein
VEVENIMVSRNSQFVGFLFAVSVLVGSVGCATGTAVVATPPPPPPPSTERVLLEDEFDAYNPQWRQVRGQWAVQNGEVRQVRDDPREANAIMYFDPLAISDAEVLTSVRLIDGPTFQTPDQGQVRRQIAGAGLVFRYQDENNYYMFRLAGEEGAVLGKMENGQWHDLANPRAADFSGTPIRSETDYVLRVRVEGNRIQCWIADRAVVNLQDSAFSTGRVGLVTFRTQARFGAVRVTER